ncbi:MAG: hypothetical protein BMS9Abin02_0137 [Anaerolineae bacterium]|nr:MAG: hypothetical protein BMS9Abin02_0137 [Anaerolineae bacterium]
MGPELMVFNYLYRHIRTFYIIGFGLFILVTSGGWRMDRISKDFNQAAAEAQGQTKLVLAFYYAWYDPGSFGPGQTPFQPPEPYTSSNPGVIQRHIDQARSAGIDAFVQSWYGPSPNQTDSNFRLLLDLASASGFKAAVDFETGSPYFKNNNDRITALSTLISSYSSHPSYLRVDGKPVIFFWANGLLTVEEWNTIRNSVDPGRNTIWIAEGGQSDYLSVFDGLHLYNIAWSDSPAITSASWAQNTRAAASSYGTYKYWVGTAMPGFNDALLGRGEATLIRSRDGGSFYQSSFSAAAASGPDMIIINSFNEWKEGSNIEPSKSFGNYYLDLTAQLSSGFKSGNLAPISQIAPTEGPLLTPLPTSTPGPSPTATKTPLPTSSPTPVASPTAGPDGRYIYLVQPGDTLTWIADRFGVALSQLYELNELESTSVLVVNQEIILGIRSAPSGLPFDTAFPGTITKEDGTIIYTVVEGDTLFGIASRYDLELGDLLDLNNNLTEESVLLPGRILVVGRKPVPAETGGSTQLPTIEPTTTRTLAPTEDNLPSLLPTITPSPRMLLESAPTSTPGNTSSGVDNAQIPEGLLLLFLGVILLLASVGVFFLYLGRRK